MGPLAATFWGRPSRRVPVVGVTGTSGKTTTTHLLASVLEHHGWPTAVTGTLSGPRTTPEAPELQALLAAEVAAGPQAVSMAVSPPAPHPRPALDTTFSPTVLPTHTPNTL